MRRRLSHEGANPHLNALSRHSSLFEGPTAGEAAGCLRHHDRGCPRPGAKLLPPALAGLAALPEVAAVAFANAAHAVTQTWNVTARRTAG